MKKRLLSLLSILLIASPVWAADTDIYGVTSIGVKPNVLIIFDNSGSMGTEDVPGDIYDPNHDYSYTGGKSRYAVYRLKSGNYNTQFDEDVHTVLCDNADPNDAKTDLLTKGYWIGNIKTDTSCGGSTSRDLRTGNFLNFDAQGLGALRSRVVVAKDVIAQLVYDNYDKVRFGLMKFNAQTPSSYYGTSDDKRHESGYIIAGCGATKEGLIGSFNPATTVFTDSDQSASFGAIGGMFSDTYTPLSETMAEAGRYFAGVNSWYNGTATGTGYPYGKFSSTCAASNTDCQDYSNDTPIQYRCQKNYIIFMTDGEPTRDSNSKVSGTNYINNIKIPAAGHDGVANYLDDTAWFLAHNDLMKVGATPTAAELLQKGKVGDFENQTVTTYTIGFKTTQALLQAAATNGGGTYYTANNASALNAALSNIITDITAHNEAFSAAAVPVSRANKAYAGNYVYYGLFQPRNNVNWSGNLKKYGITDLGVIQDKNSIDAVSGGVIIDNAQSYWSPTSDGPAVIKGGAGEKLSDDIEAGTTRKIYTYTGSNTNLTHTTNGFISANETILKTFNANLDAATISSIRHDTDSEWPLGSFLHSQPLVVHYDDNGDGVEDHSMIFAGANDGMLHCFDDNDGAEKWGFIPQDLLAKIDTLPSATSLQYYVDGSPSLYAYDHDNNPATQDKKILIVGERRGGNNYIALDISDYNVPLLKYEVKDNILGGGTKVLGESWGKPEPSKIGYMDGTIYKTKDAFIMAGGYDSNQDNLPPAAATDTKGRAVFAIDSQTGTLQTNINFNVDNFSNMTHSIVAVSPFENPKSRTTTRVYAGDMNGNLFAFRDDIFHRNQDISKAVSFDGDYDGKEDGTWGQKLKLFSSGEGRKILYPPNILNAYFPVTFTYPAAEIEGATADVVKTESRVGDYVFYGTGDREHPDDITITNEFYAIKNNWQWSSTTPNIVKAYVAVDGNIKAKDDNRILVATQRNAAGEFIANVAGNGELFIIDVTDDLFQNKETNEDTSKLYTNYIKDAIQHSSNRGWYLRFVEADGSSIGEKIVSTPIIFGGVIYFTTYVPEGTGVTLADPCGNPGARGSGYLYAIGYKYGDSSIDFDPTTPPDELHREDRRKKLSGKGIPPEPVLVVHEGKPTIIAGFETIDPAFAQSVGEFYWKQISN
jgi:type IV pilus assembly protein PilY1